MSEVAQRRIWLCADDYGISPAVNAAIRDLISRRRLNATSVMVVAPSFRQAEATALIEQAGQHAAIGLHVTLTAPFRPLSQAYAPMRNGAFLTLTATAGRAIANVLQPQVLEAEIESQFAAFREAFGRVPDFVDGHQHAHLFPQIDAALMRVAKRAAPQAWLRQCERAAAAPKPLSDPKGLILDAFSRRFRRLAAQSGMRTNPAFAGTYAFNAKSDYTRLFPVFLEGLPEGGVVMCHPGRVDAELSRLDPVTDLREREHDYLGGEMFSALLTARRITLA